MPHVSRVQGGEYPSCGRGNKAKLLVYLRHCHEKTGTNKSIMLRMGTAIEWNFAVDTFGRSTPTTG